MLRVGVSHARASSCRGWVRSAMMRRKSLPIVLRDPPLLAAMVLGAAMSLAGVGQPGTMPVIRPPAALGLDPFYTKWVDAQGLPVVSSSRVPDAALFEARAIVNPMLERRPEVRAQLAAGRGRMSVIG